MFSVNSSENGIDENSGSECWIKPMNCPGHMEVFRLKHWSYRDLPIGFAEYSPLHRNESSGAIGGLTRTRCFCQDDAHVFCSPETLQSEIKRILLMVDEVYSYWFNMEYKPVLSTRPEKFMGEISVWDDAENALKNALKENEFHYEISPGEGAFYGPKIDFIVKDSLGREWQTATIQLDFQLPERFGLEYTNKENHQQRPIVIHRAIFGSFERFIAILLENFDGRLPFWLAPTSIAVLPISEKVMDYAQEIQNKLVDLGVRSKIDTNGTLSQKILVSHEQKIPYSLILGEKEKQSGTVTLKSKDQFGVDKQETIKLHEFFQRMIKLNTMQ